MKTYCKKVDITDRNFISLATYDCLNKKYGRNDVCRLLSDNTALTGNQVYYIYRRLGKRALWWCVEFVIDAIRQEIVGQKLELVPIWYKTKADSSSKKIRRIGIQDVKQQIYDYIAVYALEPIFKRFGEFQCASIKGRGQMYGVKAIRKWLTDHKMHYVAKADVRHCFESIDQDLLLSWMRKRVKNPQLMWLVETLLHTFEKGLSIGSYLSQHLCNLYMSIIYHYMSENAVKVRKHKDGTKERVRPFSHIIIYMDDILLVGERKSDLHRAMKMLVKEAKALHLEIKDSWSVFMADDYIFHEQCGRFIDMMGVKIYRQCITIRKRVWKRIRSLLMRLWKSIKCHLDICSKDAKTLCSYYGLLKHTNSKKIKYKYHVRPILKRCKEVIRVESRIIAKTRPCAVA